MTAALLADDYLVSDRLEDATATWANGDDVPESVQAVAHPSLSADDLAEAWAEFVALTDIRDSLGTGVMSWAEYDPDLRGYDRQEYAHQMACRAADEARSLIQFGGTQ